VKTLARRHAVAKERIVKRHGVDPLPLLKKILSTNLFEDLETTKSTFEQQESTALWSGGYFAFYGTLAKSTELDNAVKAEWRKEYLPGATSLAASTFCASLVPLLTEKHPVDQRLRVTLHRAIHVGKEEFLQQCCPYTGVKLENRDASGSGRTFAVKHATIGLAYRTRKILTTKTLVKKDVLNEAMNELNLNDGARAMRKDVKFIMAIPLLEPMNNFTLPSPVCGVLYVDSTADNFKLGKEKITLISSMTKKWLEDLIRNVGDLDRVYNFRFDKVGNDAPPGLKKLPIKVRKVFEFSDVAPPKASEAFQLNFDYNDFRPVGSGN